LLQHRVLQINGPIGTAGLALDKSHLGNDVPRYRQSRVGRHSITRAIHISKRISS
jgi:hypothetical protein